MERYGKKRENSFEKPLKAPCFDEFTRPPWCNYSDGNCMFSASKDAQMQPQPCGITEFSTDPSCFAQCCCGSLLNMLRDGHVLGKGVAFLGSSTLEERRWLAGTWARTSPSQILQFWINIYIWFSSWKNNIWKFENVQLRRASFCIGTALKRFHESDTAVTGWRWIFTTTRTDSWTFRVCLSADLSCSMLLCCDVSEAKSFCGCQPGPWSGK